MGNTLFTLPLGTSTDPPIHPVDTGGLIHLLAIGGNANGADDHLLAAQGDWKMQPGFELNYRDPYNGLF